MLLACLFSMSILTACSAAGAASPFRLPARTHGAERARAHVPGTDRYSSLEGRHEAGASPEDRSDEGDAEKKDIRVRRALRQYPEEFEHRGYEHPHADMGHRSGPTSRSNCDCPEVLTKGTLIVIVAALAFLGFFSSAILLGVAVCILRMVAKQRKKEKEEKLHSSHRRHRPPVPPPRPEHTYMNAKAQGYERLHVSSQHATQGIYLRPNELHPGPRIHQEKRYQNVGGSPQGPKSPLESKYVNMEDLQPKSLNEGSPAAVGSPKRRESHIYEEVE